MRWIGQARVGSVVKVPIVSLNGAVGIGRARAREGDRQRRYSAGRGSRSCGHGLLVSVSYDGPGDLILSEAVVIGVTGRDGIAAPHAVDRQVVRACRDRGRKACGEPGAVIGGHQISGAVVEDDRNIEIRPPRGRIHRERDRSGAGLKGKHIDIGACFDNPGRADSRAGERRGRAYEVAMVVRAIAYSMIEHDGEVVFGVVCIRVFTLAPLHDVLVVTHSHDRRPVALTGVIGGSADHAIVT